MVDRRCKREGTGSKIVNRAEARCVRMRRVKAVRLRPALTGLRRDSPERFRGWRQGDYAPASLPSRSLGEGWCIR
jgi:hypothetical protein